MNSEHLHDAITLLPEDILEPVDVLRQKKRFPWKSILATAACLCLVVGLALGYARLVAPASAENAAYDADAPIQEAVNESKTDAPSLVEVVQVEEDHIFVVNANSHTSDSCALRAPIKISFEKLSQVPVLEEGQLIKIYWSTDDYDASEHLITPYRIEIAEE